MPTDEDRDNAPTTHEQPAPAAGATPTFGIGDVREAFKGLAKELLDEAQTRYQAANRPAPRVAPAPEGPTEEEFNSLDENQRRLVDKAINRATYNVRQELGQFRELGLSRLAELTTAQAAANLPYYKDYKTEIDAEMAALDPTLRTDPNTVAFVHDRVAMRHEPERIKRIQDEAIRSARGDAPAPSGTTSRSRTRDAVNNNTIPTAEELGFNDDQIAEIERMGGPDAFARRISEGRIADWKAYTERNAAYRSGRVAHGKAIPFKKADATKLPKTV